MSIQLSGRQIYILCTRIVNANDLSIYRFDMRSNRSFKTHIQITIICKCTIIIIITIVVRSRSGRFAPVLYCTRWRTGRTICLRCTHDARHCTRVFVKTERTQRQNKNPRGCGAVYCTHAGHAAVTKNVYYTCRCTRFMLYTYIPYALGNACTHVKAMGPDNATTSITRFRININKCI